MEDRDESDMVGNMDIRLVRHSFSDQGVAGYMFFENEDEAAFATLELPWRNNRPGMSCIPRGAYDCVWRVSPKFGPCYHILDVPGRSNILFHHGNYAGDKLKGLRTDSLGCILLGNKHGVLGGQKAVTGSRAARTAFETRLDKSPFLLTISER